MQIEYRDSAESRVNGITYHLAVKDEWESQRDKEFYKPQAFAADGFIHCTDGLELLTEIANMFYKASPEERTVLVLAVNEVDAEVCYDDPEHRFPHIYGALNTSAVIAELPVRRADDGTFLQLGSDQ